MKQVPPEVIESIRKNKVCLKGGLKTPMGGGVSSLNVQLRKELDLYASLVNCFNLPSLPTRPENVDIFCSEQIAKYAFEYAYLNNRKKVTAVHKANIMKLADGLFLESCRKVATKYPSINYNEIIVDNCCMQIISYKHRKIVIWDLVLNLGLGICPCNLENVLIWAQPSASDALCLLFISAKRPIYVVELKMSCLLKFKVDVFNKLKDHMR
ncbi:isocitrate dehydrogenase [NAD] regulatory subunit 1 [Pyrus ussuriensis x Pyrus communis]|uniref:Isocitrate dehydrogenase [NAD] regulatory subunit 1 n=1 Tax=Pyrus ussuriensis x Pyrus communis TaxID=2448454 RepID=A0A5N5G6S6_9ROSA|nr:isocitrate dehydrogenase [NAD] regulatory subunit 1 [Pyrus ussuriensis x Pyrus communis]